MDISKTEDQINEMVKYWKAGDANKINDIAIEDSLREHPELLPILEEILFKRNVKMAEKVKGYLATDQTYFVVVGAAHLVGDKSMVKFVEKAGFQVKKF